MPLCGGGANLWFLGPNGAGKSTLVKILVGLLFPTSGTAKILGRPLGDLEARRKTGFLPENFRYQDWLTGEELLSFHASLYGLSAQDKKSRIPAVLEQVGLSGKERQRVGTYSKGMQQRIGLACALLPDPELVFLDEPTSALDPLGRREVRQIILDLRRRGKTVFLNSHLLSEVEMICDQVAIIHKGRIISTGVLEEMLSGAVEVEVQVEAQTPQMLSEFSELSRKMTVDGSRIRLSLNDRKDVGSLAGIVVRNGGRLFSLKAVQGSLEDLFIDLIQGGGGNHHAGHNPTNL